MFHFTCSKRSLPLLGGGTARTVAHHVQHARDRRREGHGGAGCGRRLCKHLQRRHAEARQLQHSEDGPRDRRRPRRRPRCVCSPAACAPQLTTARARGSVICAAAALSLPRAGAERPILCRVQVIRSTRTRPSTSRPRAISLCREHTRATDTRSLMPGAPRGATTTSGATVARATTAVDASPGGGRHGTRIAQRRRGHHDGAAGWTAGGVAAVFYSSFRPGGLSPQGLHAVKTCLQHHAVYMQRECGRSQHRAARVSARRSATWAQRRYLGHCGRPQRLLSPCSRAGCRPRACSRRCMQRWQGAGRGRSMTHTV